MKKKVMIFAVALLLVLSIVQVAAASGMGKGDKPQVQSGCKQLNTIQSLKLTDDQVSKIREIQQKNYQQTRNLRIQLQDKAFELRQLQLVKNPDKNQIEAKQKEVKDLRVKINDICQQSREQCLALLTQEQLAQLGKSRGGGNLGISSR